MVLLALALVSACTAGSSVDAAEGTSVYQCNFGSPKSVADWNEVSNDGALQFGDSSVLLNGNHSNTGLPELILQPNHFPAGDYTASICFRFSQLAAFGSGVGFQDADGKWIARIWSRWLVQMNTDIVSGISGPTFQQSDGDTTWHVFCLRRTSGRCELFVDGRDVGGGNYSGTISSIFLGGGQTPYPDKWTELEVKYVRIEEGSHILSLPDISRSYPDSEPTTDQAIMGEQSIEPNKILEDEAALSNAGVNQSAKSAPVPSPVPTKPTTSSDRNDFVLSTYTDPPARPAPVYVPYAVPVVVQHYVPYPVYDPFDYYVWP